MRRDRDERVEREGHWSDLREEMERVLCSALTKRWWTSTGQNENVNR